MKHPLHLTPAMLMAAGLVVWLLIPVLVVASESGNGLQLLSSGIDTLDVHRTELEICGHVFRETRLPIRVDGSRIYFDEIAVERRAALRADSTYQRLYGNVLRVQQLQNAGLPIMEAVDRWFAERESLVVRARSIDEDVGPESAKAFLAESDLVTRCSVGERSMEIVWEGSPLRNSYSLKAPAIKRKYVDSLTVEEHSWLWVEGIKKSLKSDRFSRIVINAKGQVIYGLNPGWHEGGIEK